MRSACLRLPVKGIRCSCQIAFAVKRDILARNAPSRASSMDATSSIPHGRSLLYEDCSLWLESFAAGAESVAGFHAEDSPPIIIVHSRCGYNSFMLINRRSGQVCSVILLHNCVGPPVRFFRGHT